jgi:putative CocE/NonD family hydrolase
MSISTRLAAALAGRRLHYGWVVAAATFLVMLVTAAAVGAPGVLLLPLQREFGWSTAAISSALAIRLLLFGLMGPFAAAFLNRYGLRRVTVSALTLICLGLSCSLAMTHLWQLELLWGVTVGIGTGLTALVLAATVATRWFSARRGLIVGLLTASSATGQLIFLPLLAAVATRMGWRSALMIVCVLLMAAAAVAWILLRDRPADVGLEPYGAERFTGAAPAVAVAPPGPVAGPIGAALAALRDAAHTRTFWILFTTFFICGASTNGLIQTHFIPFCSDKGLTEVAAAGVLATMGVFDFIGTVASGWLSDRYNPRNLLFWYYGLRGLSLIYLPLAQFSYLGLSAFALFYGLDWIATVPPTVAISVQTYGREKSTLVFGWVFAGHQLGAATAAFGAGLSRTELASYLPAFMTAGALCLLAAGLALMLGPKSAPLRAARLGALLLSPLLLGSLLLGSLLFGPFARAADPGVPEGPLSEVPAAFTVRVDGFDYTERDVMIAMRDGVRLHTVILIPHGAQRAPILLTRTPYGARARIAGATSAHLAAVMDSADVADEAVADGGYIRVSQDVRGKHGSEGDYVLTRALHGPLNPTPVDHATDTYDTIDWLVKNLPESNGKVGILGISYDGFTALMALVHPHPALRAAVPINAMVDGWRGDDWFHNGAFRQDSLVYAHEQEATRASDVPWWSDHYDDYDSWLAAGSAGGMARLHGLEQLGFAQKLMAHPAYDAFWQDQALDKILAAQGVTVPVMLVHSLWDQEDIYGNIALYKALQVRQSGDPNVFLVLGPWFHHQERLDGSRIGAIEFGSDTAQYFRRHLLRPFLDHFLKDDAPPLDIAAVSAFETGTNRWLNLPHWPAGCAAACRIEPTHFYLQPGGGLGLEVPGAATPGASSFESYVADPAKPVPYLPRPIHIEDDGESSWQTWLVSDQRNAASRTDVLSFTTPILRAPLKLSGEPIANLIAATSGTDGDFVVKLIDVYPDEMGRDPKMGGYQLMVSADILRGRYRDSFSDPKPIPAGTNQLYRFALPTVNHVFLPGHRIMVQVQSSWFPLYDRNPQRYVENIFFAKPGDYQKATIKIFDGGRAASFVELPVVKAPAVPP